MPSDRSQVVEHPLFARTEARIAAWRERRGVDAHRRELLAGARGRVIEIGAGTGLTFAHYPREVSEVLAFEPEPYMRSHAERAAEHATVPIRVFDGLAQALPVEDGSFDVAVAALVLCSVPDQSDALAELHRVLRPGGELRFYEHVVSDRRRLARAQRVLDVAWPAFAGGCHTARDTAGAIEHAGFEPVRLRRLSFRPCVCFAPVAPMVIGCARRLG